jgi:DNA-directed RNA polymerase specialized sigma24 family protein
MPEDLRDEFLALIMGGCTPREAASALGTPLRYFRKLRNPADEEYEEQFAIDYDDVMEACDQDV